MSVFRRVLRPVAVAAAVLALSAGTAVAGTAHAAVGSASCGWINIGSPGNYTLGGSYAGQVEQEYNTCNGQVMAHWQWSSGYRSAHRNAHVVVMAMSWQNYPAVTDRSVDQDAYVSQDVFSGGIDIHVAKPDMWFAYADVYDENGRTCRYAAGGSVHDYATGGNGAPDPSSC
ncbi:hypothetical protein [Streptomyces lavendulae]|uniref:hypothetical protein n=1 Tax=Streptomyces lavendulae TaxID=1914 RepID=UPI0024A41054|nr:hypothetical protein Sros01_43320 [Streptomyces roseochromogenus]